MSNQKIHCDHENGECDNFLEDFQYHETDTEKEVSLTFTCFLCNQVFTQYYRMMKKPITELINGENNE